MLFIQWQKPYSLAYCCYFIFVSKYLIALLDCIRIPLMSDWCSLVTNAATVQAVITNSGHTFYKPSLWIARKDLIICSSKQSWGMFVVQGKQLFQHFQLLQYWAAIQAVFNTSFFQWYEAAQFKHDTEKQSQNWIYDTWLSCSLLFRFFSWFLKFNSNFKYQ